MASSKKETLYIDVDDEITSVIDKVRNSRAKIVALVLPKRATVLSSIINMKLLKKTADSDKKSVVLITSEAGLLPIAGAVGMFVSKSLSSKPTIPPAPKLSSAKEVVIKEAESKATMQGALSRIATAKGIAALDDEDEEAPEESEPTIEPDSEVVELDNVTPVAAAPLSFVPPKEHKNRRLKVPNFDAFRLRVFLGVFLLVAIVLGWYLGFNVMPKAVVHIKTEISTVLDRVDFTVSTATKTADIEKGLIPAEIKEVKKSASGKSPVTGTKDLGEHATGSVEIFNCGPNAKISVPAGTAVSTNGLNYITQKQIYVYQDNFDFGGNCKKQTPTTVDIIAQNSGPQYNIGDADHIFTVAGFSVQISGKNTVPITGGTSNIIKVVSDADVQAARDKLNIPTTEQIKNEVLGQLERSGFIGLQDTYTAGTPVEKIIPAVGEESAEVTVTQDITYSMLGIKSDVLTQLLQPKVLAQITTGKQKIIDLGLSKARITAKLKKSATESLMTMEATSTIGPDINTEELKKQVAGKKQGDIQDMLQNYPGVKDVTVTYKPFWVFSTPNKPSKIQIILDGGN